MFKGLLMMTGMFICMLVYGPKRYKQLKISWSFQLFISGLFAITLSCSMIGLMESVGLSIAIMSFFIVGCVIWAIVVRKKYPIEKEIIEKENIEIFTECKYVLSNEDKTFVANESKLKEEVIICKKCGAENNDVAAYCSSCGKALKIKAKRGEGEINKTNNPSVFLYFFRSSILVLFLVIVCLLISILKDDTNTEVSMSNTDIEEDNKEEMGRADIIASYEAQGEDVFTITWDEFMAEPGKYEDKIVCFEAYLSSIGDYAGYSLTNKKENISYDSEYDYEIINQYDFSKSPYIQGISPYQNKKDFEVSQGDLVWVLGCLYYYEHSKTVSGEFLEEYNGSFAVYEIISVEK